MTEYEKEFQNHQEKKFKDLLSNLINLSILIGIVFFIHAIVNLYI